MGRFGLLGLARLIGLACRGWSVLPPAPAAAPLAAAAAVEPLLADWSRTSIGSATRFLARLFPLFLRGAQRGKLTDDMAIGGFTTERPEPRRAGLAVMLAGPLVTCGGASQAVAFLDRSGPGIADPVA
jgi:hypothetical protein